MFCITSPLSLSSSFPCSFCPSYLPTPSRALLPFPLLLLLPSCSFLQSSYHGSHELHSKVRKMFNSSINQKFKLVSLRGSELVHPGIDLSLRAFSLTCYISDGIYILPCTRRTLAHRQEARVASVALEWKGCVRVHA